jgi:hypothetical protein
VEAERPAEHHRADDVVEPVAAGGGLGGDLVDRAAVVPLPGSTATRPTERSSQNTSAPTTGLASAGRRYSRSASSQRSLTSPSFSRGFSTPQAWMRISYSPGTGNSNRLCVTVSGTSSQPRSLGLRGFSLAETAKSTPDTSTSMTRRSDLPNRTAVSLSAALRYCSTRSGETLSTSPMLSKP